MRKTTFATASPALAAIAIAAGHQQSHRDVSNTGQIQDHGASDSGHGHLGQP